MANESYKKRVSNLIKFAKEKDKVTKYSEFVNSQLAEEMKLTEEEVEYYISEKEEETKKYDIGDIVFVQNYMYKSGKCGQNHAFVIIDDGQAIDINYFGFLLSSNVTKSTYPYNEELNKDSRNHLKKNSIVKCDDLIEIVENEIKFKIGSVAESDLERFLNAYEKYLKTAEE